MSFIFITDIFTIQSQLNIFQIISSTNSNNSFDSDLLKLEDRLSNWTFGFDSQQYNIYNFI
jgi:hypothetical protein